MKYEISLIHDTTLVNKDYLPTHAELGFHYKIKEQ